MAAIPVRVIRPNQTVPWASDRFCFADVANETDRKVFTASHAIFPQMPANPPTRVSAMTFHMELPKPTTQSIIGKRIMYQFPFQTTNVRNMMKASATEVTKNEHEFIITAGMEFGGPMSASGVSAVGCGLHRNSSHQWLTKCNRATVGAEYHLHCNENKHQTGGGHEVYLLDIWVLLLPPQEGAALDERGKVETVHDVGQENTEKCLFRPRLNRHILDTGVRK
ncbi:hypothetical protein B0H16DRAFT_1580085 [Mycena metata]|uniref:Uncharacterized protein n=1 Tax=Mycena metata TaxID=1033252 RepID=A0AAD7I3D4_9AGAR|nr:hypothetical protein B0H16DRAFT_1580085 [Mycena metata]